jgi:hypothetical protein
MLRVLLLLALVSSAIAFGDNPYYHKHWCNNPCCPLPLTYDMRCAKVFPSDTSRNFTCASSWTPDRLVGFAPDAPLSAAAVNSTFFDGVRGADLIDVAAIIVRRDASGAAWFKCNTLIQPLHFHQFDRALLPSPLQVRWQCILRQIQRDLEQLQGVRCRFCSVSPALPLQHGPRLSRHQRRIIQLRGR